jgi:hypothetical protein
MPECAAWHAIIRGVYRTKGRYRCCAEAFIFLVCAASVLMEANYWNYGVLGCLTQKRTPTTPPLCRVSKAHTTTLHAHPPLTRLSIGGGPGSSGLGNPLFGQSHCTITENGTVANPNRWTEKFNLLALDHVRRASILWFFNFS